MPFPPQWGSALPLSREGDNGLHDLKSWKWHLSLRRLGTESPKSALKWFSKNWKQTPSHTPRECLPTGRIAGWGSWRRLKSQTSRAGDRRRQFHLRPEPARLNFFGQGEVWPSLFKSVFPAFKPKWLKKKKAFEREGSVVREKVKRHWKAGRKETDLSLHLNVQKNQWLDLLF